MGRRLRLIAADERGWTLIELMIVCMVSIVVVGVPLSLAVNSVVGQNNATSRSAATNRVEIGVGRLLHDLRSATHATITPTSATMTVPIRCVAVAPAICGTPATQTVTWACTSGASCTRQVASGSAFPVIANLVSASFAPVAVDGAPTATQTDPAYVSVSVSVRDTSESGDRTKTVASSSTPITVTDGATLRNIAV
ncbi:MAG: hypothetical protein QOE11_3053 [Solirubrobacteraceae bacterium]|nr:hypothetical protein [Solirubrobacteraceae bacterium]